MFNTSIVVIDDNKDILSVYVELLANVKDTVVQGFSDPREALQYALMNKPDIVLTDNMMPYADGIYVAEKIREIYNPKLILASAVSTKYSNSANFDQLFKKPFNIDELLASIHTFIEEINQEKLRILDSVTNGLLGDINIIGKDKIFIENVVRTLMYDSDKPKENSIYNVLSEKLEKDQSTIRRNINKTIERSYEPNLFERIGFSKKPKNKEFIDKLLEKINENAKIKRWD